MSTKRDYKKLLLQAKQMRGQGGLAAFDRTKLLVSVFEDRDFRLDQGNVDDFQAADKLDEYVEDLCLSFLELRAMLEHFPQREHWSEGRLARMHAQMMETIRERKRDLGPDVQPIKRPRITQDEFKAIVEEKEQLQTRAQYASQDLADARKRIEELEDENSNLRTNLARAEGRISELERMASRAMSAA